MSDSILRNKAKMFAKEIVFLCRDMKKEHKESVLINQILRFFETDCIDEEKYKKLQNDCGAIRRMLIASLKTIKSK